MSPENKVRFLSLFFLLSFGVVLAKLIFWQVFSAERLTVEAERQHFSVLSLPARRGEILTADGFALAADKDDFLLYVNRSQFSANVKDTAEKIAEVLAGDVPQVSTQSGQIFTDKEREDFLKKTKEVLSSKIESRLTVENAVWANLAHFVSRSVKEKIAAFNIAGLGFVSEQSRDYPEASMAAHVLGFVGFDEIGNPKGYFGLEGKYEREMAGKPGQLRTERDAFGRPIAIGTETKREKQDGRDLVLTLDRAVQRFTEKYLEEGIAVWQASGGTAMVMDPVSGAILAMANFPRYDPQFFSYYPTKSYKNPAVADLYEPGSILKPLIVAAALNENKITPETRCGQCDGPRKIGTDYIHTFDNQYRPNLNVTETLINSDNTGMVAIGEKLGFDNLYSYLRRYGFGQKSGVDLEEEEEGRLRDKKNYYPIDKATLTFGQGINVNAVQLVRAWAALANGGYLVTPHLVDKIKTTSEEIALFWPKGPRILSGNVTQTVTEMLVRVTDESPVRFPRDRIAELAKFRLAAKSGTAQIAIGGKYQEKGTTASVIGFFPADKPRFLVMVKLNEPKVRPWGSDTAGPVFFNILRDLVLYYGLSP